MDRKDEVEIMEDSKVTETVTEQVKGSVDKDYGWLELDPFDDDNWGEFYEQITLLDKKEP